jgi:hypothetical protein
MTTPLKEALVALTDALAKRPAEEILFQWFRSGRLIGELSDLMKRRHPALQIEIDRLYQEHQAKRGNKDWRDDGAGQRVQLMPLKLRPTDLGSGIAVSRQVYLALFLDTRLDLAVMPE